MSDPPNGLLDLTHAVAEDVRATLCGELDPQSLSQLVDEVYELAATLTLRLEEAAPPEHRRLPVCRSGCDSCCRVHHVFVTPLEALRLVEHLRATRSVEEVSAIVLALEAHAALVAPMTVRQRAASRLPCPLLDATAGTCTVHPARPLLCRGYNSADLESCRRAYDTGNTDTPPPGNVQQAGAHRAVFAGLVLAGTAMRTDGGPYELSHCLLAALTEPDAEARWKRGEPVFARAISRVSDDHGAAWEDWAQHELARRSGP